MEVSVTKPVHADVDVEGMGIGKLRVGVRRDEMARRRVALVAGMRYMVCG